MTDARDIETLLLGPVLPDRDCGDCTACCTTLTVNSPDFSKPAGVPCEHLGTSGCTIHAVRPHICRTWFCAWRRVAEMPDAARPDRSGLLASVNFVQQPRNRLEAVSFHVRTLDPGGAINTEMARNILDALCDRFVAVWFTDGAKKMLMHPENDVAAFVLSGDPPPAHLAEEVAAWRERYGVFSLLG